MGFANVLTNKEVTLRVRDIMAWGSLEQSVTVSVCDWHAMSRSLLFRYIRNHLKRIAAA
jgi:hypothetical protein